MLLKGFISKSAILSGATILVVASFVSGCASGTFKARKEQRDGLTSQSGLYCDFVSGDVFPDVEVETNIRMAQKCDGSRPFSLTSYRNSSSQNGLVYCCSVRGSGSSSFSSSSAATPSLEVEAKKEPKSSGMKAEIVTEKFELSEKSSKEQKADKESKSEKSGKK